MKKKLAILLTLCLTAGIAAPIGTPKAIAAETTPVAVQEAITAETTPVAAQEAITAETTPEAEKATFATEAAEIPEGYTPIYDIADLYAIRNAPEDNYILMNDIDMSEDTSPGGDYDCGTGWDPIETFSGILDGNGHRIIGMQIFGEFEGDAKLGLFERLGNGNMFGGASVKNLGLVDCEINVIYNSLDYRNGVGALAGSISTYSTIECCYSSGNITVQSTCETDENDSYYVGGIVGRTYSESGKVVLIIENCFNICEIDCSKAKKVDVGGIGGHFYLEGDTNIEGIKRCYNAGNIIGAEQNNVGAICGYLSTSYSYSTYSIENCKYLKGTATKGIGDRQDTPNCVSLSEGQMKMPKVFTGFDFTDTWEIDPYCSYPYPQLKNNRMIKISSINLNSTPSKLIYNQGENINLDGAALEVTYEDGISTMIPLAANMLSGYDMKRIGAQTVTVTYGGIQTSFDIEVKEVPVSIIKIPSSLTLNRSQSKQLNVTVLPTNASNKSVSWKSDTPSVASVDKNGFIKAKSKGTATITVTSSNGLQSKCRVTVLVPAVSVQISKTSLTLKEGKSSRITAKVLPLESTNTIEWESSNESVAEVYNGTITAKKAGKATIRAYTENGVKASCSVTVQKNYDKDIQKVTSAKAKINSAKNVKDRSIQLSLKRMSNCNGYFIQYGVKKNFKGAKAGTINKKYTIAVIPKLKKGKTYYVRARIYKKIGNKIYFGKWSNVKKVKIKK